MRLFRFLFLIMLFIATGCTEIARVETSGEPGDPREIKSPQPAQLVIAGQTQLGGVGSYCWTANNASACVDTIGIPTSGEPLQTEGTFTAQVNFPYREPITDLGFYLVQVTGEEQMDTEALGYRWWPPAGAVEGSQFITLTPPRQNPTAIDLTLDPGLYLFQVFVIYEGLGDVTYGFLVEVTE